MKSQWKHRVLELMEGPDYTPMNARAIGRYLGIPKDDWDVLEDSLETWVREGLMVKVGARRYEATKLDDAILGRIQMRSGGKGVLEPDNASLEPIPISPRSMGGAMHRDRVAVQVRGVKRRDGMRFRGAVIRILERARTHAIGKIEKRRGEYLLFTEDSRLPPIFHVEITGSSPVSDLRRNSRGKIRITDFGDDRHPPSGVLETVLDPQAREDDVDNVMHAFGLPFEFSEAALGELEAVPAKVRPEDIEGRKDCRRHRVITIDPVDAKDFDDAICVEATETGWRLWVHIADVSHYVKPGSALDADAKARGNSTYLVDRVIPMLPEKLSNGICSLRPKVDRLTKCVEFRLDRKGKVLSSKRYAAVIHSKRRFAYEEALTILQKDGGLEDPIERMVQDAGTLSALLRKRRMANGSINVETPEYKIWLNDDGSFDRVEVETSDPAHQLIEEFMLLANDDVAKALHKRNQPGMYRVHKEPAGDRLTELRGTMIDAGVQCGAIQDNRKELAALADRIQEHPASQVLNIALLRAMTRARYAVQPLGHFGLAKEDYTHFTSPIRRYADLIVHRMLFEDFKPPEKALTEIADHISQTERNSSDAERASRMVKVRAHLQEQLRTQELTPYPAIVTEANAYGLSIDVTGLGVNGMIPRRVLEGAGYRFQPNGPSWRKRMSPKTIHFGDSLEVQINKVDASRGFLDFEVIGEQSRPKTPSHRSRVHRPSSKKASKKTHKRQNLRSRQKKDSR